MITFEPDFLIISQTFLIYLKRSSIEYLSGFYIFFLLVLCEIVHILKHLNTPIIFVSLYRLLKFIYHYYYTM